MITHYDLFAGIGGFSIALEEVFTDDSIRHIFCEWERFPTAVLKQHYPNGEFWGDIAELVSDTERRRPQSVVEDKTGSDTSNRVSTAANRSFTIVTGGFPCQPFSHAGRRKGTADDRYQWPNMFAVIRHTKPEWVIAENVRGLVTWNEGMVLEQVCTDLEAQGYEVQPFIIPAVAVGAPHRRDRVWIIGRNPQYAEHARLDGTENGKGVNKGNDRHPAGTNEPVEPTGSDSLWERNASEPTTDTQDPHGGRAYPNWNRSWQEVAFATCNDSVDDGLSRLVDGVPHSRAKWRQESLKAYGNGIVPEVAMNIMKAIKDALGAGNE